MLSLGHGLNDMLAGYFLGSLVFMKTGTLQIGLSLLMYNLLAFGGQYFVALWLEKLQNPKTALTGSYVLNVLAAILFPFVPPLSIVLAGVASAVYHVAGGSMCMQQNKAGNIGLFAAPGVLGLIAGGYVASLHLDINVWLSIAAFVFLLLLYLLPAVKNNTQPEKEEAETHKGFSIDNHDIIMILLLTVISLRSAVWNIFQLLHEGNYTWLLAIAAAAFAGKIAGGFIADKVGWRIYTISSLVLATPLITFFKNELLLFCIGIGLLQSGIPATTSLLIQAVKGNAARGVALSFGTAIILGAFAMFEPLQHLINSPIVLIGLLGVIILIFIVVMKKAVFLKTR